MSQSSIIHGMHSIAEAIKNPNRHSFKLYATAESLDELKKMHFSNKSLPENVEVILKNNHGVQEEAKCFAKEMGHREGRVPSNIFLVCEGVGLTEINDLYETIDRKKELKILALDQVTDVHNLAAIVRTASFYGINYVVFSKKGQKSFPPGFFRIASGGFEHVKLVNVSSMSKFVHKMKEKDVLCIGLSEHATCDSFPASFQTCFVMGSEDTGLSNATNRVLENFVSLKPVGQIKSLNVSVAAAVAIEKFWSN